MVWEHRDRLGRKGPESSRPSPGPSWAPGSGQR
jgi:hypothetical protein